jgi:hypothetical protein
MGWREGDCRVASAAAAGVRGPGQEHGPQNGQQRGRQHGQEQDRNHAADPAAPAAPANLAEKADLELVGLCKRYGETSAVDSIDLRIPAGS